MSTKKRTAGRSASTRSKSSTKAQRAIAAPGRSTAGSATGRPSAKHSMLNAQVKASTGKRSASAAAGAPRPEAAAKRVCRLTGSLVIRDVRATLAELCAALESGCTCVDVSGVDSIDTSGVQLLLAAAMEWRRREQSLTLTGYEHLIFGAAEQLGLQTLLPVAGGVEP